MVAVLLVVVGPAGSIEQYNKLLINCVFVILVGNQLDYTRSCINAIVLLKDGNGVARNM